jgi:hypothetical protein
MQAKIMGVLCLIYGGFITLLALIPNPLIGRIAFVFCGAVMFGVGWLLHRARNSSASRDRSRCARHRDRRRCRRASAKSGKDHRMKSSSRLALWTCIMTSLPDAARHHPV